MPRQLTLWSTALVLSTILFLGGGLAKSVVSSTKVPPSMASTGAVPAKCAETTDAEIVAAIQEKIRADKRFNDQWKHLNVSSKGRVVTLSGWVKGSAQVRVLIGLARQTKCVRRVVPGTLGNHLIVGCAAGQQQCGDICIGRNEQCNMMPDNGPPQ